MALRGEMVPVLASVMGALSCLLNGCVDPSSFNGYEQGEANLQHHKAWFSGKWSQATCKILSSGLAVNSRDWALADTYGSKYDTADGSIPLGSTALEASAIAVCPGTHFCADEGDICTCYGAVHYAAKTHIQDGRGVLSYEGTKPATEASRGMIVCSHDPAVGGTFEYNPAPADEPWIPKACWCTPKNIQEEIAGVDVNGCVEKANADWTALSHASAVLTAATIEGQQLAAPTGITNVANTSLRSWNKSIQERRLFGTRRRRSTQEFAPWALVKVSIQGIEEVRCAFEYGVARASFDMNEVEDALLSEYRPFLQTASSWRAGDAVTCWVRGGGEIGNSMCAVALKQPNLNLTGLAANHMGKQFAITFFSGARYIRFLTGIVLFSLILGIAGVTIWVRLRRVSGTGPCPQKGGGGTNSNEQPSLYKLLDG